MDTISTGGLSNKASEQIYYYVSIFIGLYYYYYPHSGPKWRAIILRSTSYTVFRTLEWTYNALQPLLLFFAFDERGIPMTFDLLRWCIEIKGAGSMNVTAIAQTAVTWGKYFWRVMPWVFSVYQCVYGSIRICRLCEQGNY